MSIDPRMKMQPYEIGPVNTYLNQERIRFYETRAPQIVATLTEDGRLKELDPLIGADNFEIPENIKELAIREFSQALNNHGFDVKSIDQDYLEITKGVFNMRLDTKDQVPFSDVTLRQVDMVYQNFMAARTDACQCTRDMIISSLGQAEKFTKKDADLFGCSMQRDMEAKAKSVKTYLAYNPDNNLYKIGKSENPSKSVSLLRYIEGSNLEILYVINEDLESDLRKRFAIHCHAGEWFTDEGGSMQTYFKKMSEKAISND